ncbi:MAG: transposase [Lacticaseibacillus paracasei]
MPTRYDKEFKQNIINLYKQGESAAQLAREYGIGYSTVHKWIQGQAKSVDFPCKKCWPIFVRVILSWSLN